MTDEKKCQWNGLLPSVPTDCLHCVRRVSKEDVIACRERSFPARGVGDVIATITDATGISTVFNYFVGEDCGCSERREKLNAAFPFRSLPPD